jgi:hypothetical protein
MVGFREDLSPYAQKESHLMLYLYIPPLKQFHEQPPEAAAVYNYIPPLLQPSS